jgi:hypothetical protein
MHVQNAFLPASDRWSGTDYLKSLAASCSGHLPVTKGLHLEARSTARPVIARASSFLPNIDRREKTSTRPRILTALGHSTLLPPPRLARSDHNPKLGACPGKMRYREGNSNSGEPRSGIRMPLTPMNRADLLIFLIDGLVSPW